VLQERTFDRVGGHGPVGVDIRVMAATNRDLGRAVQEGRFRDDLFFRLNVIPITVPPLRERRPDIPLLAEYLVNKLAHDLDRPGTSLSAEALQALLQHDWPGNVRELQNALERAVVLSRGEALGPEDLALGGLAARSVSDYRARLAVATRDALAQALRDHGGDKRAVARALGIALSTLYEWLRKHDIGRRPGQGRQRAPSAGPGSNSAARVGWVGAGGAY
jgi:DNA-binding NtrC family response regulator